MIAIETLRHRLALAVRVDDHFAMAPDPGEHVVTIDSQEPAALRVDRSGVRHDDGTYRFLEPVAAGARQIRVVAEHAFTWAPTTAVTLPLVDPLDPLVIETWPTPSASVPAGTLAIRGRLVPATAAPPVAAGQEVRLEVVRVRPPPPPPPPAPPPRNRRTRGDATGEFLFVVHGPTELFAGLPAADKRQKVKLGVTTPGRAVASIDVFEGASVTTFIGPECAVLPGRETRVLIKLS